MLKKVGEDNVYIIDLCTYKYISKKNRNYLYAKNSKRGIQIRIFITYINMYIYIYI